MSLIVLKKLTKRQTPGTRTRRRQSTRTRRFADVVVLTRTSLQTSELCPCQGLFSRIRLGLRHRRDSG